MTAGGSDAPPFATSALRVLAGLLVWGAHLGLVYGIAALACARSLGDVRVLGVAMVPLAVGAATVLAAAAAAVVVVRATMAAARDREGGGVRAFLGVMTAILGALSLLGILWTGSAIAVVPAC
jgi:hypothetical protein